MPAAESERLMTALCNLVGEVVSPEFAANGERQRSAKGTPRPGREAAGDHDAINSLGRPLERVWREGWRAQLPSSVRAP